MTDRPIYPLEFNWNGEAMIPRRPLAADRQFVVGETYRLDVIEERSINSHHHYFSALNEAWKNLPDAKLEEFPTSEHLRKKMLIKAGYRDERSIVCASKAEALRVASFIRPIDEYAMVIAHDNVVLHLTAKSQNFRSMDKKTFQDSKEAVLGLASAMIGVTPAQLQKNAGASA